MMKKSELLKNFPAYFAYLLSGLAFFSLPTKSQSFAGVLAADIIVFAAVFFALKALAFLKERAEKALPCGVEKVLSLMAAVLCAVLFSFFTKTFADRLPEISKEFAGGRFSQFFVILSLLLALYIGKRGFFSYSGVCILVLPLFLLPNILTFFNFLDFGGVAELENAKIAQVSFDFGYFFDAFLLCAGSSALLFMNDRAESSNRKKVFFPAFLIFSVVVLLEGVKYLLWFGIQNLGYIDRPDRVMLSQVPFMNVQELFLFSYYTAYMLKISVFAAAARTFLKNIFSKLSEQTEFIIVASVFYLFYLFLPISHTQTLAVIAFCGLYICGIAIYISRIFAKKRAFCKKPR